MVEENKITNQTIDSLETIDLSDMTKSKLLDYAEQNGIEGVDGSMRKDEIIEIIESTENSGTIML